jgi:hypothetical protein
VFSQRRIDHKAALVLSSLQALCKWRALGRMVLWVVEQHKQDLLACFLR